MFCTPLSKILPGIGNYYKAVLEGARRKRKTRQSGRAKSKVIFRLGMLIGAKVPRLD